MTLLNAADSSNAYGVPLETGDKPGDNKGTNISLSDDFNTKNASQQSEGDEGQSRNDEVDSDHESDENDTDIQVFFFSCGIYSLCFLLIVEQICYCVKNQGEGFNNYSPGGHSLI